jgi:hypothetical protein
MVPIGDTGRERATMKPLTSNSTLDDLERWLRALDVRLSDCVCIAGTWHAAVSGWVREGVTRGTAVTASGQGVGVAEAIFAALAEWHTAEALAMQELKP